MAQPNLEQLLEAGVHFGHQTRRWNPKMRRFIFAERNGIHIIDLQKTLRQLELAQKLAREVILRGDNVLFVCTKRQLVNIVKSEAERRLFDIFKSELATTLLSSTACAGWPAAVAVGQQTARRTSWSPIPTTASSCWR